MNERVTVDGTVQNVIFHNAENGYTVLKLSTLDGDSVIVVGCIPGVAPGEGMSVSGAWENHPQHGQQLRAEEVERHLPEDPAEIYSFLSSGVCQGLGRVTARRMVETFKEETLSVLEQEPERLTVIRGMTLKKARELSEAFRQTMGLRRLMAFLSRYELPPILAMRLRERYGDTALSTLTENPWLLSMDENGVSFALTDRIAMSMGFAPDCEQRVQAALIFMLNFQERNGHVFLPKQKLIDATARLLDCPRELPERELDALTAKGDVVREEIANESACYLRRMWEAEASAQVRLEALLSAAPDKSKQAERVLSEVEQALGVTYAEHQREAVRLAARVGVLILTGGPGTGKTTTVRGIVALFQRMGLDMELSAPTGRAAQRLGEVTGMEAQTVHRLLGMTRNDETGQIMFTKSEKDPLKTDAVIIDEMSMVDLPLFSALLRALRPGTRLVLVGDADQLPSVGAGNVFSDLIRSGRIQTVFLREIFRQAEQSAIIRNAHAVNTGQPPRLLNDQEDFFFLRRPAPEQAAETIVELCQTRLPQNMGVPHEQIQVLTPTRKGVCGTVELNRRLQEALNPKSPEKRELRWGDTLFREGDKVMQTRNNYDVVWTRPDNSLGTGIFNGDVGQILQIDPSGQAMLVDFDGRAAPFSPEMLNELELAYAVTVHKAQGSEYRAVVMAAVPAARSLMTRGILYTALTRARELMILVGDPYAVGAMSANDWQQRRYSGLRWRLSHGAESGATP
ncbi:MAG: ATP-dependent RecD-like DNA helicase [Oscillospiraceae bacterium]|nr:ATP-dependent RecD-like DNA helicase [Oscillospiraceae bacterium]